MATEKIILNALGNEWIYRKIGNVISEKVRFDVPESNRGQIVEKSFGGFKQSPHDIGDLYYRVVDRSLPAVDQIKTYQLAG